MAMKEYVAIWEQNPNASILFDQAGNKISVWYNPNSEDYGHFFYQPTQGGSFHDIDWDGNWVKYDTELNEIDRMSFIGGMRGVASTGKVIDSAGNYYLYARYKNTARFVNPSSLPVILKFSTASKEYNGLDQATVFGDGRNNANGFLTVGRTYDGSEPIQHNITITTFDGVEYVIFMLKDDLNETKLWMRPTDASTDWVSVTLPADVQTWSASNTLKVYAHPSGRLVYVKTGSIAANTNFAYVGSSVAPMTFTPYIMSADTTYIMFSPGEFTESGIPQATSTSYVLNVSNDTQTTRYLMSFNILTGSVVFKAFSAFSLNLAATVVVDGYRIGMKDNHQCVMLLSNGKVVTDAFIYATTDTGLVETKSDAAVLLSTDMNTVEKVIHASTGGESDIWTIEPLFFNTYQITGNVKVGGVNTAGLTVGLLNSEGKCYIKTTTDVSGNYTLICLDGNPKQVIVYEASGKTSIHLVTPVEVL